MKIALCKATVAVFVVLGWMAGAEQSFGGDPDGQIPGEPPRQRADVLRERAERQASQNLGYTPIYQYPANRQVDSYALTLQISHLAQVIQNLANAYAASQSRSIPLENDENGVPMPMSAPMENNNVRAIYGPEGPTAKSVGIVLDYQLLIGGNRVLKKGKIEETADAVHAEVVTSNGKLVREFVVDKNNGLWTTTGE